MLARIGLTAMWLLRLLPMPLLACTGALFGRMLYVLGRERRKVCLTNLSHCFPDVPQPERVALAKRHFEVLGRSLLERGIMLWSSARRIERLVRVRDKANLDEAVAAGPVILLAPHFVGLDIGMSRLAIGGLDMTTLYANQKNPVISEALRRGRTRFGNQDFYSRQEGVRAALAAMKQGKPLYYLPDMDYGPRDAIFVPFFGVPAATITGLARIAKVAGARVVPCVTRMLEGGAGYEIRCYPAWDNYPSGDMQADIERDTRRMNAFIEDRVREMPEQYLWTHKRFKTRPAGEAKWYS